LSRLPVEILVSREANIGPPSCSGGGFQIIERIHNMLVLTRKTDERIRIGDDITITIVKIEPGKVRVGIEAPADVAVHRQEIYQAIQRDKGVEK